MCEPCKNIGKFVKETKVCHECPERLCDKCSIRHQSQRATKHHVLENTASKCEPCGVINISIKATGICVECEECLCDDCILMHGAQKATKHHRINKITSNTWKPRLVGQTNVASIKLDWEKTVEPKTSFEYEVYYKEKGADKWKCYDGTPNKSSITINDLDSNTTYIFKVRMVFDDNKSICSDESDEIKTAMSAAAAILERCENDTREYKKRLLQREITDARNEEAKTRKVVLVSSISDDQRRPTHAHATKPTKNIKTRTVSPLDVKRIIDETTNSSDALQESMIGRKAVDKTIMLVGETGTGKSTLVDGLVNYILGVNFDDPYRFTLVDPEKEEQQRSQAYSQTQWITTYRINHEVGSRLAYTLNIIDTPGFGDTQGIERDREIVSQIRQLFDSKGPKGVMYIDAICFLAKSYNGKLTQRQDYIFSAILAMFGENIKDNITFMITFADVNNPPVIDVLKEFADPTEKSRNRRKIPFDRERYFLINNSGLFDPSNSSDSSSSFWKTTCRSFRLFFDRLSKTDTQSLQQTKDVLLQRRTLELTIENIQPKITAALNKLNEMNKEKETIIKHEHDIKKDINFNYKIEETIRIKHDLPEGQYTTICLQCNETCHKSCPYKNDKEKINCIDMDKDGRCTECVDKCVWELHSNIPYIYEYVTEKKEKTFAEWVKKYKIENVEEKSLVKVVNTCIRAESMNLENDLLEMMDDVNTCCNKLNEIALIPNNSSLFEYIDHLIDSEKHNQTNDSQRRIISLRKCKERTK